MFRQQDNQQLYPDIDLSPLPPRASLESRTTIMGHDQPLRSPTRRSYQSGMNLDQLSMIQPLVAEDSLPMQPARRTTLAHSNILLTSTSDHDKRKKKKKKKNKKKAKRSISMSRALDEHETTPLPRAPERMRCLDDSEWHMRRKSSDSEAHESLRWLAISEGTPKRPSVAEQEEIMMQMQAQQRRSRRRSQDHEGGEHQERRRYKSVDDMTTRLREEEQGGRKVIRSPPRDGSPSRRRGRSPAVGHRALDVPGSIKIVQRGHSCGGRIPCSNVVEPEPVQDNYRSRNVSYEDEQPIHGHDYAQDDDSISEDEDDDDDSSTSTSSSFDDFDAESLALKSRFGGSVHEHHYTCNQTQVWSALSNFMSWQNGDGSVRSTSSPENREAIQKKIDREMSSLTDKQSHSHAHHHPMQQQHLDDSKRTAPTASTTRMDCGESVYSAHRHSSTRVLDCGGSVYSAVSGTSHMYRGNNNPPPPNHHSGGSVYSVVSGTSHHMQGNMMMRPWICLCGEDNEPGFAFCGMCGSPEKWTCGSCHFNRNKNRSPHCGGCGLKRGGGMMGNNSSRSNQPPSNAQPYYSHPIAA